MSRLYIYNTLFLGTIDSKSFFLLFCYGKLLFFWDLQPRYLIISHHPFYATQFLPHTKGETRLKQLRISCVSWNVANTQGVVFWNLWYFAVEKEQANGLFFGEKETELWRIGVLIETWLIDMKLFWTFIWLYEDLVSGTELWGPLGRCCTFLSLSLLYTILHVSCSSLSLTS